jgi:hypothetical protein
MEPSPPWEAKSLSAIQEFPKIVWNAKTLYLVRNSLSLVPVLNLMNPIHITPSYFTKIHFNIILLTTSRSP